MVHGSLVRCDRVWGSPSPLVHQSESPNKVNVIIVYDIGSVGNSVNIKRGIAFRSPSVGAVIVDLHAFRHIFPLSAKETSHDVQLAIDGSTLTFG